MENEHKQSMVGMQVARIEFRVARREGTRGRFELTITVVPLDHERRGVPTWTRDVVHSGNASQVYTDYRIWAEVLCVIDDATDLAMLSCAGWQCEWEPDALALDERNAELWRELLATRGGIDVDGSIFYPCFFEVESDQGEVLTVLAKNADVARSTARDWYASDGASDVTIMRDAPTRPVACRYAADMLPTEVSADLARLARTGDHMPSLARRVRDLRAALSTGVRRFTDIGELLSAATRATRGL